jgi:hypothetical protein
MKRLRAQPADPQNPVFLFSTRIARSLRGATGNSRHIRLIRNVSSQPFLKSSLNSSQYSASSAASAFRTPEGNGFASVLPSDRVKYLPHLATFHHFLPTAFPSPFKHLRTLPFCVGHKSFVCHSYENTGGMGVFFPIWFPRGASPHGYAVYSAVEEIPR